MVKNKRLQFQIALIALLVPLVASIGVLAFSIVSAGKGTTSPPFNITSIPAKPTDVLTLNLAAPGATPINVGIGTNIQGWKDLTPPSEQRAQVANQLLAEWKPTLVRVHVGFRGDSPGSAPEQIQGQWDFSKLDAIISDLRAHNISYFLDIRTAPPWMYDNTGHLPIANFPLFAQYMARIVAYYNKGGFTDENGVFHKGHTNWVHAWEIWNEPKSGWDIPVCNPHCPPGFSPAAAPWMRPEVYAELYNTTVTAMKAVDPTIITGGPALNSYPDDTYFQNFLQNVTAPLDFLSFHFYAGVSAKESDQDILSQITGPRFLDRLLHLHAYFQQYFPNHPNIPIWITELGINEASTTTIRDLRGTGPMAYAFLSDSLTTAYYNGVQQIDEFAMESDAQLGLMDIKSYKVYRPFYFYKIFTQEFPQAGTLIPIKAPVNATSGVTMLAYLAPDGKSLRLLVGNIKVANPKKDVDGTGVAKNIRILLSGSIAGHSVDTSQAATIWRFDTTAPADAEPAPTSFPLGTANGLPYVQGPLAGYGAMIISVPLK